ncbi:MAG: tetratricopeptide repeat protein [Saprospiraceae bacterium]|nr:tetratricopeptide repeat protein [Saprospiraceae bacterium]
MKPQLMLEIRNALNFENYAEALQKAQQLINLDPNDADAYLLYGDVFKAMDNGIKAVEQYEKALAIQPGNAEGFFKLGNAYEMREDEQSALSQYQSARRLDPSNNLYLAYHGRLLNKKGLDSGNINYENEGLDMMEKAYQAGVRDENLHEQLAIAHLCKSTESWRRHPEQADLVVPTEQMHVEHAKIHLEWVRNLYDRSNQAISQKLAELDNLVRINETKQFAGYPYLRKAPLVVGGILLVFGFLIAGGIVLLLAGLYHVSQLKPGYMINRMQFPGEYRHPFIVRRLDQMDNMLSGITFFDSSLSRLLFHKFLFGFAVSAMRYCMVIMMLPYEIVKGFLVNHGLKEQLMAKMRA